MTTADPHTLAIRHRIGLVLMRATIWGIAGGFFGIVYIAFLKHLQQGGAHAWQPALAAGVAGAVVGTFYSAKRVALAGAVVGSVASLLLLILMPRQPAAWLIMVLCALAGLPVGAVFSVFLQRRRASMITAAGFATGLLAGLVGSLLSLIPPLAGPFFTMLATVPLTGVVFVFVVSRNMPRLSLSLPHWLDVGLVCAIIAGVVGVGLWVLAAARTGAANPALHSEVNAMLALAPLAFGGGLLGGALAGTVLQLLGARWLARP